MLDIENVHKRTLSASDKQIGTLISALASAEDHIWPKQWWPAMRLDPELTVGAVGGHGPIRYTVESYTPSESVVFRFIAPPGFHGTHAYHIESIDETQTRLWHVLAMRITGPALLSWPLIYRPLHNALIEDSFNVAEAHLQGSRPQHQDWSWYVRLLRRLLGNRRRR